MSTGYAGCAPRERSEAGASPRKGRRSDRPESTENSLGYSDAPEYPEEELAAVARAYRVPLDAAVPWVEYDRACSIWRQRVLFLLPTMLGSPDAYIEMLSKLQAKKDGQPVSEGWRASTLEALEELIAQLLRYRKEGQSAISLALEINAEFERHRRHPVILELATGGWLPRPPTRPDCRTKPRDPKTEAERMANADRLAEEMVEEPEQEVDRRALAGGGA